MTTHLVTAGANIGMRCREWLKEFVAPPIALPSVHIYLNGWKKHHEYIIAGHEAASVESMIRTLVQPFAESHGQVVWIGTNADFKSACERMIFNKAGIPIPLDGVLKLDLAYQDLVNEAYGECCKWPIHLLNIDECGDGSAEQKFFNEVSYDRPTLIVVEPSIFDDVGADPLTILTRRVHLHRMIAELTTTIPDWRILWNLPLKEPSHSQLGTPALTDILEEEIVSQAHAVLLTHPLMCSWMSAVAHLIVAKNSAGRTGTIELRYAPAFSSWTETGGSPAQPPTNN